ncbi:MAG: SPOR domain-containing protein [Deltaproteobacteria bacterium]|nr:SPOR domain-containing protein [Deltaproteobacteria bacterium]
MGEKEHQEIELEQDLDNIYRKVASLDHPEGDRDQPELNAEKETLVEPGSWETLEARPARENNIVKLSLSTLRRIFNFQGTIIPSIIRSLIPRRSAGKVRATKFKFRISAYAAGIVFTLFCLGMIGVFFWPGIYRHETAVSKGGINPPPVPPQAIKTKAEEVKVPTVAALPAEEKESKNEEPPVVVASAGSHRGKYAIQIRAYPENKKQDAIAFLEKVRKKMPDVSMETVPVAGSGVWHRILIGSFSTTEEAADYRERHQLAREHPDSFIQKKSGNNP